MQRNSNSAAQDSVRLQPIRSSPAYVRTSPPTITARARFLPRILLHAGAGQAIVLGLLLVGTLGYPFPADLVSTDAFMNAAMLLGGMGPVEELHMAGAKIFAACHALYAGMVFLLVAGILIAPLFHRFLHRFHLELNDDDPAASSR